MPDDETGDGSRAAVVPVERDGGPSESELHSSKDAEHVLSKVNEIKSLETAFEGAVQFITQQMNDDHDNVKTMKEAVHKVRNLFAEAGTMQAYISEGSNITDEGYIPKIQKWRSVVDSLLSNVKQWSNEMKALEADEVLFGEAFSRASGTVRSLPDPQKNEEMRKLVGELMKMKKLREQLWLNMYAHYDEPGVRSSEPTSFHQKVEKVVEQLNKMVKDSQGLVTKGRETAPAQPAAISDLTQNLTDRIKTVTSQIFGIIAVHLNPKDNLDYLKGFTEEQVEELRKTIRSAEGMVERAEEDAWKYVVYLESMKMLFTGDGMQKNKPYIQPLQQNFDVDTRELKDSFSNIPKAIVSEEDRINKEKGLDMLQQAMMHLVDAASAIQGIHEGQQLSQIANTMYNNLHSHYQLVTENIHVIINTFKSKTNHYFDEMQAECQQLHTKYYSQFQSARKYAEEMVSNLYEMKSKHHYGPGRKYHQILTDGQNNEFWKEHNNAVEKYDKLDRFSKKMNKEELPKFLEENRSLIGVYFNYMSWIGFLCSKGTEFEDRISKLKDLMPLRSELKDFETDIKLTCRHVFSTKFVKEVSKGDDHGIGSWGAKALSGCWKLLDECYETIVQGIQAFKKTQEPKPDEGATPVSQTSTGKTNQKETSETHSKNESPAASLKKPKKGSPAAPTNKADDDYESKMEVEENNDRSSGETSSMQSIPKERKEWKSFPHDAAEEWHSAGKNDDTDFIVPSRTTQSSLVTDATFGEQMTHVVHSLQESVLNARFLEAAENFKGKSSEERIESIQSFVDNLEKKTEEGIALKKQETNDAQEQQLLLNDITGLVNAMVHCVSEKVAMLETKEKSSEAQGMKVSVKDKDVKPLNDQDLAMKTLKKVEKHSRILGSIVSLLKTDSTNAFEILEALKHENSALNKQARLNNLEKYANRMNSVVHLLDQKLFASTSHLSKNAVEDYLKLFSHAFKIDETLKRFNTALPHLKLGEMNFIDNMQVDVASMKTNLDLLAKDVVQCGLGTKILFLLPEALPDKDDSYEDSDGDKKDYLKCKYGMQLLEGVISRMQFTMDAQDSAIKMKENGDLKGLATFVVKSVDKMEEDIKQAMRIAGGIRYTDTSEVPQEMSALFQNFMLKLGVLFGKVSENDKKDLEKALTDLLNSMTVWKNNVSEKGFSDLANLRKVSKKALDACKLLLQKMNEAVKKSCPSFVEEDIQHKKKLQEEKEQAGLVKALQEGGVPRELTEPLIKEEKEESSLDLAVVARKGGELAIAAGRVIWDGLPDVGLEKNILEFDLKKGFKRTFAKMRRVAKKVEKLSMFALEESQKLPILKGLYQKDKEFLYAEFVKNVKEGKQKMDEKKLESWNKQFEERMLLVRKSIKANLLKLQGGSDEVRRYSSLYLATYNLTVPVRSIWIRDQAFDEDNDRDHKFLFESILVAAHEMATNRKLGILDAIYADNVLYTMRLAELSFAICIQQMGVLVVVNDSKTSKWDENFQQDGSDFLYLFANPEVMDDGEREYVMENVEALSMGAAVMFAMYDHDWRIRRKDNMPTIVSCFLENLFHHTELEKLWSASKTTDPVVQNLLLCVNIMINHHAFQGDDDLPMHKLSPMACLCSYFVLYVTDCACSKPAKSKDKKNYTDPFEDKEDVKNTRKRILQSAYILLYSVVCMSQLEDMEKFNVDYNMQDKAKCKMFLKQIVSVFHDYYKNYSENKLDTQMLKNVETIVENCCSKTYQPSDDLDDAILVIDDCDLNDKTKKGTWKEFLQKVLQPLLYGVTTDPAYISNTKKLFTMKSDFDDEGQDNSKGLKKVPAKRL